jgi:tRNA G18 (ribose-2'-O)-methylase SpoU
MMPAGLPHVEVLLDNIRSLYNVGALLRTADGVGVRHMHLCGISATPDHPQLAKTALGAGAQMRWSYAVDAVQRARQLKASGYVLWALEDTAEAHSIFVARAPLDRPLVVVVGNERLGVDPELLALCDAVWVIPMYGLKDSLNVAVAFGVAIYQIMHAR